MSLRLYEIPQTWAELQDALEAGGGELTPEVDALWSRLEEEGPAKVEAAACVLAGMKAEAEALVAEIGRLQQRKQAVENSHDRLRALILPAVVALGGKVKGTRHTVSVAKRKGYAWEVIPGHETWELGERFYRIREPELNKTELKKAYEAGETMPAALHVLETETVSLVIR